MRYEVTAEAVSWTICPSSGAEEIIQNVKCLLMTAKGTVFFYREYGLDCELIDKPLPIAQQKFLREVVRMVKQFEPRCEVKRIRWAQSDAADGILKPIVEVDIDD